MPFDPYRITGFEAFASKQLNRSTGVPELHGMILHLASVLSKKRSRSRICGFSLGKGGAEISTLQPGGATGRFEAIIATVMRLADFVRPLKMQIVVRSILMNQGESNAASTDLGLHYQSLLSDFNLRLKAVTGQRQDIVLQCVQPSSFANSSSGVRSILSASSTQDGRITLTGPTYWQKFTQDWLHHPSDAHFKGGELAAIAHLDGKNWSPMRVSKVSEVNPLTFDIAWTTRAALDTERVMEQRQYGLQFREGSSNYKSVRSQSLLPDGSVRCILRQGFGRGPRQLLVGLAGHGGTPVKREEVTIPRCNWRSASPAGYSTLDGNPLYRCAVHEQFYF